MAILEKTSPGDSSGSSSSSDDNLPVLKTPKTSFGTEEESRFLQHWLLITSPMISQYGPQHDFFTVLVPQLARISAPVRHMMTAVSMMHKKFHYGVNGVVPDVTSSAISHYVAAITDIRNKSPSKLEVLATSLCAWCMELMQNNFSAVLTHLRGSMKLLQECEDAGDGVPESVNSTVSLAKGLTTIMLRRAPDLAHMEPEYLNHLYAPWIGPEFSTIHEAREAMCGYIDQIALGNDLEEHERNMGNYVDVVRRWDQQSIQTPDLAALLLLFNVGMALLPPLVVEDFSYEQNPVIIKFVVDKSAEIIPRVKRFGAAGKESAETLRRLLRYVTQLFPHDPNVPRAKELLQRLDDTG
jgi:hypothetical protein